MLKKFTVIVLSGLILSSCATGPRGYFKRSANNKLFDREGFQGGKRAPLYNKKYVNKAKYNVANHNIDEDDLYLDEEYDPSNRENIALENREMYRHMLELEASSNRKLKGAASPNLRDHTYPSISKASSSFYEDQQSNQNLKKELDEIKSMLNEAKRDMSSRQCPSAAMIEQQKLRSQPLGSYSKPKIEPGSDSTLIEPVKSI